MSTSLTEHRYILAYGRTRGGAWRRRLRMALLATVSLAGGMLLAAGAYDWWHGWRVRQVKAGLAEIRALVVVDSMWETDHGGELPQTLVTELSLHIADRPDATIQLSDVSPDAFSSARNLRVYGFGGRGFRVERTYRSDRRYTDYAINIGPEGEFAHLIPFPVRNVRDLVARYDDLVAIFEKWPEHPAAARLEQGPGRGWTYSRDQR